MCGPNRIWNERLPVAGPLNSFYAWARTQPINAVFIQDPSSPVKMSGNVAEFPAFAQRALWVDQPSYMTTPYPSFQRRFDLAVAATRGDVLTPGGAAELLRLQRPLFVVSYQARDRQLGSRLEARYGPPVFAADFVAVYRFAP